MAERATQTKTGALQLDAEHPWPGLVSFTEAEHSFFFGREREVAEVARLIRQKTLTVFFGKSGLGKSSILRAGVSPILRSSEFLPIYVRLNYAETAPPLEDQVEIAIEETLAKEKIDAAKPARAETLWEYFHKKDSDWWDQENRLVKPVLIFDQFEELLTLGQSTPERLTRSASFLTELEDLVENRPPEALRQRFEAERGLARGYDLERVDYRVVLALREDFLPDLEGLRERLRAIMFNRFRLLPMSGNQAMDVVLKPGGHLVDEDVAVRIVDFVSSSERSRLQKEVTRAQIAKRPIEPALLSVVLQELNNRRIQAGHQKITGELVGKTDPTEIFHDFYLRGLQGMDGAVREFIEDSLLTGSGARNRIAEEDALTKRGISADIITKLIDRRIVQRETTGNIKWLELTHDTLADVVRTDRAEHQQQRELEIAAAREAEARKELRRVRKIAISFAALLALAAIILAWAFVNHAKLAGRAEDEGDRICQALRKERMNPAPGGPDRVKDAIKSISDDAERFRFGPFLSPKRGWQWKHNLKRSRAEALTLAAEILYFHGRYTEGLKNAEEASSAMDALAGSGVDDSTFRRMRANSYYVLGRGLSETGKLSEAQKRLEDALKLTTAASSEAKTVDRTQLFSETELGNVNLRRASYEEARKRFTTVLADLKSSELVGLTDIEVAYLKTLALQGLGLSQVSSQAALHYLEQAKNEARTLAAKHPDNLLLRTLEAQIFYQECRNRLLVASASGTITRVQTAVKSCRTLYELDNSNLFWTNLLARALRLLGTVYQDAGELSKGKDSFEEMCALEDKVYEKERSWIEALYVRAASRDYLAKLELQQSKQSSTDSDREKDAELKKKKDAIAQHSQKQSSRHFDEAQKLAEDVVRVAPECYDLHDVLFFVLIDVAESRGGIEGRASEALDEYNNALSSIERLPKAIRDTVRFHEISLWLYGQRGYGLIAAKKTKEATDSFASAVKTGRELVKSDPTTQHTVGLATALVQLGDGYLAQEDVSEAAASYDAASRLLADDKKQNISERTALLSANIDSCQYVAQKWYRAGHFDRAIATLQTGTASGLTAWKIDRASGEVSEKLDNIRKDIAYYSEQLSKRKESLAPHTNRLSDADRKRIIAEFKTISDSLDPQQLLASSSIASADESQNWPIAPVVPGSWVTITAEEQSAELARLASSESGKSLAQDSIARIRILPLSFYDGVDLCEAEVHRGSITGIRAYLRWGSDTTPLDGTSQPMHEFNRKKEHPPVLETAEQAAAYLRYFMGSLQGEEGTFRIIDRTEDVLWTEEATEAQRRDIDSKIVPMTAKQSANGIWYGRCTVKYSDAVFQTLMRIEPSGPDLPKSGNVEMTQDAPIGSDLPVVTEVFNQGLHVTTRYFAEKKRLEKNVRSAKDWTEKVATQRTLTEFVGRNAVNDETRKRSLPIEYLDLSWFEFFDKHFADALAASEAGLKWNPENLQLQALRAHELLFLDRSGEAEEIYRRNIGKTLKLDDKEQSWQDTILADFDALEKKGLSHAKFSEVRELLNAQNSTSRFAEAAKSAIKDKNWAVAVEALQNLIKDSSGKAQLDDQQNKLLPSLYLNLSWCQLQARDFAGALSSAETGLKIDPDQLPLETNRAHALLFLGRTDEAEEIYRKYIGRRVGESGRKWEEEILNDFDQFEENGLTHPEFNRIREVLKSGKS